MAVIKAVSSKAGIGQALDYVTKEEKTEDKLVSGLHCEPDTVKDEMQATKELWGKTGGRTYKHFVHSYHEDEHVTPEQAHKNAIELAKGTEAWKGHEVLIATHIEKLNEADNVLKLNAELKKQNEKLKQDKLNAEQEAEATVSSVKREYEAKGRELDRRIGEAAKQSASLKSERQSISEDIEQRATAKYLDQKKELDRKFKAQTASYDSFLLGLLLYGVLTTVFTAVRSEAFVSDFKTFFMVIWQFIVNAFQLLLKGGQWASQLGDKIPQPVVATIVHYLLLIVFVGGIAIGVGVLIFLGASKVFEFYTDDYADTLSLAVFLISLAVSVYFAEPIRAVIPIKSHPTRDV